MTDKVKKILQILLFMCAFPALTHASSFSSDLDFDIIVDINQKSLRQCRADLRRETRENRRLSNELRQCELRNNRPPRRDPRLDQLTRENRLLQQQNTRLRTQVRNLQRQLDDLRRGGRPGQYDPASAIRACSQITSSIYSRECVQLAQQYRINAETIEACAEITSSLYAKDCVKYAGQFNANEFQVRACAKITSSLYSAECVKEAGRRQVHQDVIYACIDSNSSSMRQKDCVASM